MRAWRRGKGVLDRGDTEQRLAGGVVAGNLA